MTTIGEVGDGERSLRTMAAYTAGGDKLHMCYTFDFLSPIFTAQHFRERIVAFEAIVGDGWPCWAFSNHDIERHVTRWAGATSLDQDHLAVFAAGILLSLRGSVCLYQGRRARPRRSGAPLRGSRRSLRHSLLAGIQGPRRLPYADGLGIERSQWRLHHRQAVAAGGAGAYRAAANREAADSASVLSRYRQLVAFRRQHPALRAGRHRLLRCAAGRSRLRAGRGTERVVCVFNFGRGEARFTVPAGVAVEALEGHGFAGRLEDDGRTVRLPPGEAFFGELV